MPSLHLGKRPTEMPGNGCSASEGDADKAATLGGSRVPLTVAGTEEALVRVPGVALLFSDTVTEVPAVFTHMLRNLPAMYETVILVTVRCAALIALPQEMGRLHHMAQAAARKLTS